MVRYFLCSNEQPLHFTAKLMINFSPDDVCLQLLSQVRERSQPGWLILTSGQQFKRHDRVVFPHRQFNNGTRNVVQEISLRCLSLQMKNI